MTICPIAIAVGCQKCPVFKICPVKSVLGDVPKASDVKPVAGASSKPVKKAAAKPAHKTAAKKAAARKKTS
ncbi:MAG: hypothetical protein GW907_14670 [Betaproteobacteria bacterium]|nr:hypothetical protein [Betaproteobacteria bacterium]PJC23023.1 MAG: hypothetical protein CO065_00495 [Comamonadaceae bacterium CG_4_9_14_0_8_um_filter_57_21]